MATADLNSLTVKELRDLAIARGVPGAAKLRKEQLLAALAGASAQPAAPSPLAPPAGSSSAPEAQRPPPAVLHQGPDPGLPIPERYGRDRLVLMVQDPFHVFAYWELTPETLERARAAAGGSATPVLLLDTGNGSESREVDLRGGNYYLSVAPSTSYEARLALRDAAGNLHLLTRSNRVSTPSPSISQRQDEAWMSVDETFSELLEMAGLPGEGGGSVARLAETNRRMVAWNVHEVDSRSMFSGLLLSSGMAGFSPSSTSLSSTALSSGALSRQD